MVNIEAILASNTLLSDPTTLSSQSGLTFVFAGATAGIGLSTLKAFAKHAVNPTAYIIGRSRAKFQAHLVGCLISPNRVLKDHESPILTKGRMNWRRSIQEDVGYFSKANLLCSKKASALRTRLSARLHSRKEGERSMRLSRVWAI